MVLDTKSPDNCIKLIYCFGNGRRHAAGGYSSTLVRGATYLATNLVRSAGSTARFFDTSAPILIDKISPATVPKEINPNVQKTVKIAKDYSEKALDATEYLGT